MKVDGWKPDKSSSDELQLKKSAELVPVTGCSCTVSTFHIIWSADLI